MSKAAARIVDAVGHARDQLDQVRAEAASLRAELEHEANRPVSVETIEERLDATVARLQNFACSLVTAGDFIAPNAPPQVGDQLALLPVHPFTVMAAVAPDALKSWLMERARGALATLPEPVDEPTRAKRIAALEAKLRASEAHEVALVWEMLDAGLDPDWRGDLDPVIVLGLEEAA
jgi:hypothetical protein